jgi:ATP-dependent Clp protease ATP-binding subunit ClpX
MGFGAEVRSKKEETTDMFLPLVQPDDLVKFGLIPEFVGRLPLVAPLHSLNQEALLNILTQPKNAIIKQYKKLFRMEGVDLDFEDEAMQEVVRNAIVRGTGARALRSIIEEVMLDIMYNLPDREKVTGCTITRESILHKTDPIYLYEERKQSA